MRYSSWTTRSSRSVDSEGSTTTSPWVPSTTTRLPEGVRWVASFNPTTAGMPRERAMMAV